MNSSDHLTTEDEVSMKASFVNDTLEVPAFFAVFGKHFHHLVIELLLRECSADTPIVANVFVFDGFHCEERSRRGLFWQPVSADPLGMEGVEHWGL